MEEKIRVMNKTHRKIWLGVQAGVLESGHINEVIKDNRIKYLVKNDFLDIVGEVKVEAESTPHEPEINESSAVEEVEDTMPITDEEQENIEDTMSVNDILNDEVKEDIVEKDYTKTSKKKAKKYKKQRSESEEDEDLIDYNNRGEGDK